MSITIAKNAGFCFGVSRAVETVEKAAGEGKSVVTLGPIIHNRHVVAKFKGLGVEVIESPEDARPGMTVIIRSHGVTRGGFSIITWMNIHRLVERVCIMPMAKGFLWSLWNRYVVVVWQISFRRMRCKL